jgi:hypothetical protein
MSEICSNCEEQPVFLGSRCLECWQERDKPEEFSKEAIMKDIELALKGQLNNIMSDSRPLDWKSLEQRHKDIMNYLMENLKK